MQPQQAQQQPQQQQPFDTSYNNFQMTGNQGFNNATALQIRLDTKTLIEDIELFLKAEIIHFHQDDAGKITTSKSKIGTPKANARGIQGILALVSSFINSQTVQGNFDRQQYEQYVWDARVDLACNLTNNLYFWAIAEEDTDVIIDQIMNIVEPFISRLIDNKERDSYAETIKHSEVSTMQNKTGGGFPFGLFGGKENAG